MNDEFTIWIIASILHRENAFRVIEETECCTANKFGQFLPCFLRLEQEGSFARGVHQKRKKLELHHLPWMLRDLQ